MKKLVTFFATAFIYIFKLKPGYKYTFHFLTKRKIWSRQRYRPNCYFLGIPARVNFINGDTYVCFMPNSTFLEAPKNVSIKGNVYCCVMPNLVFPYKRVVPRFWITMDKIYGKWAGVTEICFGKKSMFVPNFGKDKFVPKDNKYRLEIANILNKGK